MPIFLESIDVSEDITAYQTNVRRFRLEKGWSEEDLARAIKGSRAHIANLEAGRSAGSVQLMIRISRALRCGLDDLLAPAEESA